MTDPTRTIDGFGGEQGAQIGQFTGSPTAIGLLVLQSCNAGAIIAAIFEPCERFDELI